MFANIDYFSPRSSQNFAGLEGNSGPRTAGCWRLSDEDCTGNPVCQAQRAWEALQRAIREVLTPYKKNRARHLVCVPKKRGHVLWTFSEEEKKQFRIVRFRGFAARHARPAESGAGGGGKPKLRVAFQTFVTKEWIDFFIRNEKILTSDPDFCRIFRNLFHFFCNSQ